MDNSTDKVKAYPLPENAPVTNDFFKPESGPAIKEVESKRSKEWTNS